MELISEGVKGFKVLNGVKCVLNKFEFSSSGCTVIMGPNGCGKSTLIKILVGLESLDSGTLHFTSGAPELMATVLQNYKTQLLLHGTVDENITVSIGGAHGLGYLRDEAVSKVLTQLRAFGFNLQGSQLVGSLSGGEQQALVLARSFLAKPSLWLLDEPVSAIDFKRRATILQSIKKHSNGGLILMSTHDINDAIFIGDRLIVYNQSMDVAYDQDLSKYHNSPAQKRLASNWAMKIRQDIMTLTHHLSNNEA